jgi:hypothetical protein
MESGVGRNFIKGVLASREKSLILYYPRGIFFLIVGGGATVGTGPESSDRYFYLVLIVVIK